MRLTATRNSANKRVSTSFYDLDLFVTVQLLDKTPAVLLLYVFFSKRGYSYEWKTAKLYDWPKMKRQLFVQWTTQYFSLHQDCHHIPAAFLSSTSRWKDQTNYSRKLGPLSDPVTTRSDKHACGKPMLTDHEKQATENREPANEMHKENATQGSVVRLQPFTVNLEDLERCARTFFWKSELRFGRWRFESGHTKTEAWCSCLLPQKPKDIYSARRQVWWYDNSRVRSSTKDVNLGTITETLSWYKFSPLSGIRVRPKLHRRRRRIYVSSSSRRRSQELFTRTMYLEFGKYCEEISWNHRTTTLYQSDTSRIAEWAVRGAKEVTSAVLLQFESDDKWWLDSMERYCYLRADQDFLADSKSQNKRRFGESFWDMLCSRVNLGRRYSDCWDWRVGKVRYIRNIVPEDWVWKKSWEPQKRWRIHISCGRWFSKIIRKRLRIPRTHSEAGIHRKERESQRIISWR